MLTKIYYICKYFFYTRLKKKILNCKHNLGEEDMNSYDFWSRQREGGGCLLYTSPSPRD